MNGYDLSRNWFDWAFDNASKIRPIHTALFFFIIEHNNRLGWKKEFGLPRQMAMEAIGVKNNRTFTSAFDDLEKWGFITVLERSKNQYSANIISIFGCVKNTPATTKALAKATHKHSHKHCTGIVPIDKPLNKEPITYLKADFLDNWNDARTHFTGTQSNRNTLTQEDEDNFNNALKDFSKEDIQNAIKGLFMQEYVPQDVMQFKPKHFLQNIDTYLDAFNNKKKTLYKK